MAIRALFLCVSATLLFAGNAHGQARVAGSNLPTLRTVEVNEPATSFATLINYGNEVATNCRVVSFAIAPYPWTEIDFTPLNAAGAVSGPTNVGVDIQPGTSQQFVLSITPTHPTTGGVEIGYRCDNAIHYPANWMGLNYIEALAEGATSSDIIAIGATPSGDQVMRAAGPGNRAVMGMAAVNIGSAGSRRIVPVYNGLEADTELTICETDSAARCLQSPAPFVIAHFAPGEVRTFNIYIRAVDGAGVVYAPEDSRVAVVMMDESFSLSSTTRQRQATSAAVTIPAADTAPVPGVWTYTAHPEIHLDSVRRTPEHTGEILIVPRAAEWADQGVIVVMDPDGTEIGNADQTERNPRFGARIDYFQQLGEARSFRFTPEVELGDGQPLQTGYVYRFPPDTAEGGNLNFGEAATGNRLISARIEQLWDTVGCRTSCDWQVERRNWNYRLIGQRSDDRNSYTLPEIAVDWRDTSLWRSSEKRLTIEPDGSFSGIVELRIQNTPSGFRQNCPFNGQLYQTSPGSAAFYVRMTVPETAPCDVFAAPPRLPALEGEYEGVMVVREYQNDRAYQFYLWTMDVRGGVDYSYHTELTYWVPRDE